jgi:hypothetical protein
MTGQPDGYHKEADVEDIPDESVKRFLGRTFVERKKKASEHGQVVGQSGIVAAAGGEDPVGKEDKPDKHRSQQKDENDPQKRAFQETLKIHHPIFPLWSMRGVELKRRCPKFIIMNSG